MPPACAQVEDRAITEIVKFQESVGIKAITDGEYRRTYFHIDFLDQLGGVKTAEPVQVQMPDGSLQLAPPVMKVVGQGAPRPAHRAGQLPATCSSQLAPGSVAKVAIPSPTMLHFRGGRAGISKQAYPDAGSGVLRRRGAGLRR